MGLILDSSIIISAERRGHSVRQMMTQLRSVHGEQAVAISVITVSELTHGLSRAVDASQKQQRAAFLERLWNDMPMHPVSFEIAPLAGEIAGEQAAVGNVIALADLLIGATALHLGYAVATLNVRHFQRIPGLEVVTF